MNDIFTVYYEGVIGFFERHYAGLIVTVPLIAVLLRIRYERQADRLRSKERKADERSRVRSTTKLLRAQFGQIGRHSATNLKRLTETFRSHRSAGEMVTILRKISLSTGPQYGDDDVRHSSLHRIKLEDLSLFPEHLARDVMRLEITVRNIEIDIQDAIRLFREAPATRFDHRDHSDASNRMASLSNTIERCALDCAQLIAKLKDFEAIEFREHFWRRIAGFRRQAFRDEPIHFTDATSLREVGDWVNWKDEQRLLHADEVELFFRKSMRIPNEDNVQVITQQFGTINSNTLCRHGEFSYCVRVRVNEPIFQYEPGLIKEVFVAQAMRSVALLGASDELLADIYRDSAANRIGTAPLEFPIGPDIYFASGSFDPDHSGRPAIVSEWFTGPLLAHSNELGKGFHELGGAIRLLHSVRTSSYYRNLRDLGEYRFARDFCDDIFKEIKQRNDDLQIISNKDLEEALASASAPMIDNKDFVLCHNDLHPFNVFYDTGKTAKKLAIFDWDNSCVCHPFLDFVKVRYWSMLDERSRLVGSKEIFERFCGGYGVKVGDVEQSPIFIILSLVWLLRISMFERKREAEGKIVPRPFQPSSYYAILIQRCVGDLIASRERSKARRLETDSVDAL